MSGYIGGILILSGCFMYGLSYSQRLKIRITILKDMVRMLSVMNNHIGYSLIDMTQIFERLGDFDMCSYVRDIKISKAFKYLCHMSGILPDTYTKH